MPRPEGSRPLWHRSGADLTPSHVRSPSRHSTRGASVVRWAGVLPVGLAVREDASRLAIDQPSEPEGVERDLLGPDLGLSVGNRVLQGHDEHGPVLAMREAGGDGSREELADRLADATFACADDDQLGVELGGELLDGAVSYTHLTLPTTPYV